MFPIKDENPVYHKSIITFMIIGLNIFSWFFVQGFGFNPSLSISVCRFGLIPGELLGTILAGTQIPIGSGLACVIDNNPNWITVFTSMFMHGGWFHIIGNMWFLFVFGDNVEDVLGPFKFSLFYILCGISAAVAQMISDPSSPVPMVGASGAISGVMGAYAVLFPKVRVHLIVFIGFFFTRIVVPAIFMLGYWILLQIFSGFISSGSGGVAFWAHVGGFVAGIIFVKLLCNSKRVEQCRSRRGSAGRIIQRIK